MVLVFTLHVSGLGLSLLALFLTPLALLSCLAELRCENEILFVCYPSDPMDNLRLTDGSDVLYNKFNVDSSSPPDNPPQRPNSDYNCVVATTGQWRVSRCDEQHHVVCQSDHDTLPGIITTCLHKVISCSYVARV